MVTHYRGVNMLNHVSLKLLLSLMVPRSKTSKSKFMSTHYVIFWQPLDATRKLKERKKVGKEKTEGGDRGCRCTSVVRMTK